MFNFGKKDKSDKSDNTKKAIQNKKAHYTGQELRQKITPLPREEFVELIKEKINTPADLITKNISESITIIFIDFLIDGNTLQQQMIPELLKMSDVTPQAIKEKLPLSQIDISNELEIVIYEMLTGSVLIHVENKSEIVIANISSTQSRGLTAPENESQVIGSQVGFNESIATSISLIRRFITSPNLCNERFILGKESHTSVSLLYIKGVASEEQVNTMRQRIEDLDVADLVDSAVLAGLIDDSTMSVFPQMLLTERPDRFCNALLSGKVGIMMNGSSMGIIAPMSFVEFFHSREDQNLRWQIGSLIRLLRFSAMIVSIFLTPIYVATLTYHYEVISQTLLVPLSESRAIVPFPPIMEALILEIIIELLREAGSRLPTKVGQTIGIVGGIVIGTAAVDAGITSNVLIIIIALSALASFTTPNYIMGNVIRFLRFPIIILAGIWGYYGIVLALCFLLLHLLRLSSLGAPYLAPLYPLRFKDLSDSIIRLPSRFIKRQAVNINKGDDEESHQQKIEKVSENE
ncbi:MAG TPA: spore germination protein [Ureibacillus sp.]|nr:spore germination protein [Ureibacillus sp.]